MLRLYWGWIKTSAGESVWRNAADTSYMSTVLATLLEPSVSKRTEINRSTRYFYKKCKE
jgi:hypothetical protein